MYMPKHALICSNTMPWRSGYTSHQFTPTPNQRTKTMVFYTYTSFVAVLYWDIYDVLSLIHWHYHTDNMISTITQSTNHMEYFKRQAVHSHASVQQACSTIKHLSLLLRWECSYCLLPYLLVHLGAKSLQQDLACTLTLLYLSKPERRLKG